MGEFFALGLTAGVGRERGLRARRVAWDQRAGGRRGGSEGERGASL